MCVSICNDELVTTFVGYAIFVLYCCLFSKDSALVIKAGRYIRPQREEKDLDRGKAGRNLTS
jgi:hypothetical protein